MINYKNRRIALDISFHYPLATHKMMCLCQLYKDPIK